MSVVVAAVVLSPSALDSMLKWLCLFCGSGELRRVPVL